MPNLPNPRLIDGVYPPLRDFYSEIHARLLSRRFDIYFRYRSIYRSIHLSGFLCDDDGARDSLFSFFKRRKKGGRGENENKNK